MCWPKYRNSSQNRPSANRDFLATNNTGNMVAGLRLSLRRMIADRRMTPRLALPFAPAVGISQLCMFFALCSLPLPAQTAPPNPPGLGSSLQQPTARQRPQSRGQMELARSNETETAGELAPRYRKFIASCESLRRGTIAEIEFRLRGLRSAEQNRRTKDRIQSLEAELTELRERKRLPMPPLRYPPDVGGIGLIPGGGAHVTQILSDESMLATVTFHDAVVDVRRGERFRKPVTRSVTMIFRQTPTAEIVAGSDIPLTKVFEAVDEETLTMSDGERRRFLVLKPLDVDELFKRNAADKNK